MSMKVRMTRDEVNKGRLIPNGEYLGTITEVEEDESKAGNEMWVVDIKVKNHPEFAGVTLRDWLGVWFRGADKLRRFIEAVTKKPYDYDKDYDISAAKGRDIRFYTNQGTDDKGMPNNSITDYKVA